MYRVYTYNVYGVVVVVVVKAYAFFSLNISSNENHWIAKRKLKTAYFAAKCYITICIILSIL